MDASRFPITTPYGQVPGYELNNGWHRGEDRAMPMDTPVLVNGHEIGLSGNTGQVTGPHLHIGRFIGGHDTPPNSGGFHFGSAVVTEVGEDSVNGKFVRVQAEGASWVYLHLSRQTVPVGQELTPIVQAPAPTIPYHITPKDPFKMVIKAGTRKWDLSRQTFEDIATNPLLTINQDMDDKVFNAELHHDKIPQYTYYLEDPNVPQGYNTRDLEEYIPPPPLAPAPPAAPLDFPKAPIYQLVTDCNYYATSTNAQNQYKPVGTLKAGIYTVIAEETGMKNLSDQNPYDQKKWVNPKENTVVEAVKIEVKPLPQPVPAPKPQVFTPKLSDADKATFKAFTDDRKPITFVLEYDYLFTDLNGYATKLVNGKYIAKTVQRHMYDEEEFSGTFFHNGEQWARIYIVDKQDNLDANVWFAIPMINAFTHTVYITPHDKIYSVQTTTTEKMVINPDAPYTKFIQFGVSVDVLYDKAKKTIDGIFRKKHK